MGRKLAALGTSVGALLLVAGAGAAPAQADGYPYYTDCELVDVFGNGWFKNWSATHVDMALKVTDEAADGHHVAIRFVSYNSTTGDYKYWSWHHLYDGNGSQQIWETYANDSTGHLNKIGIQAAVMEGSEVISNCRNMV